MKKLALVGIAATVTLGAWWLAANLSGDPAAPVIHVEAQPNEAVDPGADPAMTSLADVEGDVAPVVRTQAEAQTAQADPIAAPSTLEHPWEGQLSGVRGRLLESSGEPAAGLEVTLLTGSFETLVGPTHAGLAFEDLEVGRALTDSDGSFLISGALSSSLHALGIDLGGARGTLRVLERSLAPHSVTDVGDIVLSAFGTVVGTVIDEDGEPVEGARVRIAAVPALFAQSGLFELNENVSIAAPEGELVVVSPLPAWLKAGIQRAPVSTAMTNADGEFRLEGVPVGELTGGIDLPGFAVTVVPMFRLAAGEEHDLDELELLPGRIAQGRVIDGGGQPVAGAEVLAGTMLPAVEVAVLQPVGVTDDEGRFEAPGLREIGDVVVAARRSSGTGPWVALHSPRSSRGLTVQLEGAADLTVRVVDGETGAAVEGARLSLEPARMIGFYGPSAFLRRMTGASRAHVDAVETEAGTYRIAGVTLGSWGVTAIADGFAATAVEVTHGAQAEPAVIELQRGERIGFRVSNGDTGEPVTGAHVSLLGSTGNVPMPLASGFTAADGLVEIGPIAPPAPVTGSEHFELDPIKARVVIQHPRYGRVVQPYLGPRVELGAEAPLEPIELRVVPAVKITGQITWNGEPPGDLYNVICIPEENEAASLPSMALSDATGRFVLTGMTPGEHRIELSRRFLDGSIFALMNESNSRAFHKQAVRIEGRDVELSIDLLADGTARKGWLEGRLIVDGQPYAGARVLVSGQEEQEIRTDGTGRFRSSELEATRHYVRISIASEAEEGEEAAGAEEAYEDIFASSVRVSSGQGTDLSMEVTEHAVDFVVLEETSRTPIADATVRAQSGDSASTDREGRASLTVRRIVRGGAVEVGWQGRGGVWVGANGFEPRKVEPEELEERRVEVLLVRTASVSGTVILPTGPQADVDYFYVYSLEDSLQSQEAAGATQFIGIETDERRFESRGLRPGRYRAVLGGDFQTGATVDFDVPEEGVSDLVLDFSR